MQSERVVRDGTVSKPPGVFYRFTKDSNVDSAEVSKNGGILSANLLRCSKTEVSCVDFPKLLGLPTRHV